MRLLRLVVENIATYRRAEVDFESLSYPVAIYGDNGAGKTTLFVDAITAALYGVAYGSSHPSSLNELRGRGPVGRIELEFEVEGTRYKVVRYIHKDRPNEAYLYRYDGGWRPEATSPRQVTERIKEIVGLDSVGLLNSAIVRQGEVQELIEATRADRASILLRILRFDLSRLSDEARERAKELRARVESLRGELRALEQRAAEEARLAGELKRLEARERELEERLRPLEDRLRSLREEGDKLLRRLSEVDMALGELQSTIAELNELEAEVSKWEGEVESRRRSLAEAGLPEDAVDRLAERWEDLKEYARRLEREAELEALVRSVAELKEAMARASELESARRRLESLEAEREGLVRERAVLSHRLSEARENARLMKGARAKCPLCGAELTEEHRARRIRELEDEARRLERGLEEVEERMAEVEGELARLRDRVKALEGEVARARGGLQLLGIRPESVDEELARVSEELRAEAAARAGLEAKLADVLTLLDREHLRRLLRELPDEAVLGYREARRRLDELLRRRERLLEKVSAYEDLLGERRALEARLSEVRGESERLSSQARELESELGSVRGRLEEVRSRLEDARRARARVEEIRRQLEELQADVEAYRILSEAFSWRGLPLTLLRRYLEEINYLANRYLEEFEQPISMRLEIGEEAGKPTVELITYRENVRANPNTLSNGEKVLLGFALRLALNDLISRIYYGGRRPRFFIIDEGFGPLDAENRRRVAWALYTLVRDGKYSQLLVISHAEGLWEEEIFRTRIEVYKERGISNIAVTS